MLVVADRIHPDREGCLPCPFSDIGNRREDVRTEHLAIAWGQYQQDIVILTEGVLEFFKGLQVRVLAAEKHSVVIGKAEKLPPKCGSQRNQHGKRDRQPTMLCDPLPPLHGKTLH